MNTRRFGQFAFCLAIAALAQFAAVAAEPLDFATHIKPLLEAKCWNCHGPETQESSLRLDQHASVLKGGDSGEPAILPGNSAQSHLIQLVSGRVAGKIMPPDESDRLAPEEIELLRAWIDQGAPWSRAEEPVGNEPALSRHWSFQPVAAAQPPQRASDWVKNGVDAFILQALEEHQLAPSEPATRAQLARRMYLDLLGLPPSPEEARAYVRDVEPGATERLVERLLASPRYGERWASYWLDLVRFAETNGYETNRERPHAWPYRDYVIRALNDDQPYDQFLREQLAGDALGAPEATGYLVAGPYDLVKSPDVSLTLMQRQNELDDMIGTTGAAFLGLTIGCARCHNHKFDPIEQRDYYALQAIFAGVQHGERALPPTAAQVEQLVALDERLEQLREWLQPFGQRSGGARPSVNPRGNEERFEPIAARYVRFTILATSAAEPCLDELEVFSGSTNVALAANGAVSSCSSTLPGYAIHRLEHVNDGLFGNSHSWISQEVGAGWVQIEFPQLMTIDHIAWSRDREGVFADRLATQYRIEIAAEPNQWKEVASAADRAPITSGAPPESAYDIDSLPADEATRVKGWLDELREVKAAKQQLDESLTAYAGTFEQPGPTHRLFRGDPTAPREPIEPNTVAALGKLTISAATPEQQRRLALADWVASKDNPLTARVIVNRLWQFHFGKGLVATPSDFGAAGVPPTHPELLDWLAAELMSHGWSLKHVQRLILNSATYQQSSRPREDGLRNDAATQWWWRFPPRRLEAEPIRDGMLSVSGALDRRMYGPGFSAFEVELENVRHYFPKQRYGPEDWRRMVYMTKVRLEKDSVFGVFDCPDAATSVARRSRSTTPLQALNLLNSEFVLQMCEKFAERLAHDAGVDAARQVDRAYWLCYGRAPDEVESSEAVAFVAAEGLPAFCRAMFNSNEFIFLP